MLLLIGKQHSLETTLTREFLDLHCIPYDFIDLEDHEDFKFWMSWVKSNKILSIPVLLNRETGEFIVGNDQLALKRLLKL